MALGTAKLANRRPVAPEDPIWSGSAQSRGNPEMLNDAVGRRGNQQGGGAAKAHARDNRLVVCEACNRRPTLALVNAANRTAQDVSRRQAGGAAHVHKHRKQGDARHKHWVLLPDVVAAHCEELAAVVELDAADGTACSGGDGVEILQLAQVPQLDGRIRGAGGQVVPVLRKGQARDSPLVPLERRDVGLRLHVPDPNDGLRPGAQDEAVRMKAGAGVSCHSHELVWRGK